MTDSEIVKNAILNTLEYLKLHEPKCICEQCPFGYKFDKELIFKCKQYHQKIKEEHDIWESKILYWREKLKNAE